LRDLRDEWLGREAEVLEAPDPTLVLRSQDGRTRRVAKAHTVFAVVTDRGRVTIPGDRIRFRPEDRIKKVR
jgi:RNase P/RNase MRP subunit p29